MRTEQLLLRLPEDLIRKFRHNVPGRKRSAFVRVLLEKALEGHEDAGEIDDETEEHGLAPDDHVIGGVNGWTATAGGHKDRSPEK